MGETNVLYSVRVIWRLPGPLVLTAPPEIVVLSNTGQKHQQRATYRFQ